MLELNIFSTTHNQLDLFIVASFICMANMVEFET